MTQRIGGTIRHHPQQLMVMVHDVGKGKQQARGDICKGSGSQAVLSPEMGVLRWHRGVHTIELAQGNGMGELR